MCTIHPMNTAIKTRFAPSPTGLMHFGNVRTALFNYLFARRLAGHFLLRIEDTDTSRSESQYRDAILNDLKWLGLEWQEGPYYQSERQAIYNKYYQVLEEKGLIYPCFCTENELAITRKLQLAAHQPPRYPGTCRRLTPEQITAKQSKGISFTLRFKIPGEGEVIEFKDLIKGEQRFEASHIGDFIIRRGDGSASFMFCNAVDDALMGITHALRGDDHLTNTPRQILILRALGLSIPHYGHFPTILGPDSRPLSKRNGSRSIQELREAGYLPLGILNYLARLGHYDADVNLKDLEALSQSFDLMHISQAAAHFDLQQLNFWQKEAIRALSWEACWERLPEVQSSVPKKVIKDFVETVQPNLVMPADALPWAKVIFTDTLAVDKPEVLKVIQEAGIDFFKEALTIAPHLDYAAWVAELQQKTGRKGKAIFFPLRAALTGELHGPELAKIFMLMGSQRVKARLEKAGEYAANL